MAGRHKWDEIRRSGGPDSETRVELIREAMEAAMALGEVRQARGVSQVDLAKALKVSQSRVSKIERQGDLYFSTLWEYVAALGGQLEVRAVFDDGDVLIKA